MMYHLFENELNQISHLNTVAIGFFSAGGMFTSFLVTIGTSWLFAEKLSDAADVLAKAGCIASAILAVICYAMGGISFWQRQGMIGVIKNETADRVP